MWKARSISELFQLEEFGLSSAEEAGVQAFIAQKPDRVVLVCDGLDEGSVDEGSFLWRVMTGKYLRGLRVIITSRPCSAVTRLSESGAIHRHVQMTGFSEENVAEFALKYLGEMQGREMLSQLAEQPSVASLMHTPFFALLICEQFKEVDQLPRRRSDVYGSVTLRLVQRSAKRRGLRAAFKRLEKAPGKLCEHVLELGKVAFDRLKNKDLSYFELEEEDLSPEAIELGFLEHMQARTQVIVRGRPVRIPAFDSAGVLSSAVRLQRGGEKGRRCVEVGRGTGLWTRSRSFEHVLGVCGRPVGQRSSRGALCGHCWRGCEHYACKQHCRRIEQCS